MLLKTLRTEKETQEIEVTYIVYEYECDGCKKTGELRKKKTWFDDNRDKPDWWEYIEIETNKKVLFCKECAQKHKEELQSAEYTKLYNYLDNILMEFWWSDYDDTGYEVPKGFVAMKRTFDSIANMIDDYRKDN